MSTVITARLIRLADQLGTLRMRLKEAARYEVAQAIGDALAHTTQALICGRSHPKPHASSNSEWDDPWHDPFDPVPRRRHHEDESEQGEGRSRGTYQAALLASLATARWSFLRTGQPVTALGLGVIAAVIVWMTGDRLMPLIDVCTVASELLSDQKRVV